MHSTSSMLRFSSGANNRRADNNDTLPQLQQQQQRQQPPHRQQPCPTNKPRRATRSCNSSSSSIIKKCKIFGIAVTLLFVFVSYSYIFSWLHTVDPCVVASLHAPEKIAKLSQRNGESESSSSAVAPYDEPLPKIIHQQWKTIQIPQAGKYTEWRQAWIDLYPEPEGYTHILWTDETMRQLIATHYPWFLSIYDGYKYNIQRADVARYFILHFVGGLYADLDYQPLVNFWNRIPKDRVSLIESPYKYNEHHQNSLMASPKGDIFWKQVFDALRLQGTAANNSNGAVFAVTGPQFLDKVARRQQGGAQQPFYTLPCENFHRVPFVQHPGEETSPWITRVGHHTLARWYPMKYCGDITSKDQCQYGKHHNAVSYLKETGGLIWVVWKQVK